MTAQLASPCELTCGLVLGATGFTVATSALVARGRLGGGVPSMADAADAWVGSFVLYVGAGLALSGNGARQERAVYAGGLGALGGALVGLAIETTLEPAPDARKVAAALFGAALGAVVGGVYGALSHEEAGASAQPTMIGVRLTF
jgi:hypothetical protein